MFRPFSGPRHCHNVLYRTPTVATGDVDHQIQATSRLGSYRIETGRTTSSQGEHGEPEQSLFRGTRVNRSQGAAMSGVHGIEQRPGFGSAHFADNDAIRAVPEDRFE